mgnify:FL=1
MLKRTAQIWNLKSSERSAVTMETRIRRLGAQVYWETTSGIKLVPIPSPIVLRAIHLYRKAARLKVINKPSLQSYALALLLLACREARWVMPMKDLVNGIEGDERKNLKSMRRYYNVLKNALNLQLKPPTVDNYITYVSGKLNIVDISVVMSALNKAREYQAQNPNSAPNCVAAGALYITIRKSGQKISQKAFCKVVSLSEISLRNWIEKLGGYQEDQGAVLPEASLDHLDSGVGDEKVHDDREDSGQKERDAPAAPEEPEREERDTEQRDEHRDKLTRAALKGNSKPRKRRVRRKTAKSVKHVANRSKKSTNGKNSPVHRHRRTTPSRRGLQRQRKARSRRRA